MKKGDFKKRRAWQPDLKSGLLTLLLLPVVCFLGSWQLERAEEKRHLLAEFERRSVAEPLAINLVDTSTDLRYLKVKLTGSYDNARSWYLDNRVYQGRPGYEIISPFVVQDVGLVVLVNRGWIAGDPARRSLPDVAAVNEEVEVFGEIYIPPGEPFTLGEELATAGWPKVVQQLDPKQVSELGPVQLFPYIVRLKEQSAGALRTDWMIVNIMPEKHTAYAVQWFAMGAVLLVLFLVRSFRHENN
jgi:cytochrome oxidase assembly protein ShyY1